MGGDRMMSSIRRHYGNIHMALWAGLVAFLLFFAVYTIPRMPEARAQAEALRIHEIAEEYKLFCRKLGMPMGAPRNPQCVLELQAFRAIVEKRFAEEGEM
jgi:hypothetical protein